MAKTLYEYKEVLWEYRQHGYESWAIPYCPVHKMELHDYHDSYFGVCEDCKKRYSWHAHPRIIAQYLRRKLGSKDYQEAEIISIDGIQTPQLKTRVKIPEENKEYWIEARLNKSNKGRQIVLYVGEKGVLQKVQLFANLDQEKLSFDHKDRKPEEIFTKITATFPSGKEITINAAKRNT